MEVFPREKQTKRALGSHPRVIMIQLDFANLKADIKRVCCSGFMLLLVSNHIGEL